MSTKKCLLQKAPNDSTILSSSGDRMATFLIYVCGISIFSSHSSSLCGFSISHMFLCVSAQGGSRAGVHQSVVCAGIDDSILYLFNYVPLSLSPSRVYISPNTFFFLNHSSCWFHLFLSSFGMYSRACLCVSDSSFQLSDVEKGGNTAFIKAGVSVAPQKVSYTTECKIILNRNNKIIWKYMIRGENKNNKIIQHNIK